MTGCLCLVLASMPVLGCGLVGENRLNASAVARGVQDGLLCDACGILGRRTSCWGAAGTVGRAEQNGGVWARGDWGLVGVLGSCFFAIPLFAKKKS